MYIELGTYNSEIEAQITMGQLQEEGIYSKMKKDDVGGMFPNLNLTQGVKVLVRKSDIEKAKKIINFSQDQTHSENWICKNCGEAHEEQFTSCWNCKSEKPH